MSQLHHNGTYLPQHDLIATYVNARQYSSSTFVPTGKTLPRVSKASLILLLKKLLEVEECMLWYHV
jgi:hypothetical protein